MDKQQSNTDNNIIITTKITIKSSIVVCVVVCVWFNCLRLLLRGGEFDWRGSIDADQLMQTIDRLFDGFFNGRVSDRCSMLVRGSSGCCCCGAAEPVAVCVWHPNEEPKQKDNKDGTGTSAAVSVLKTNAPLKTDCPATRKGFSSLFRCCCWCWCSCCCCWSIHCCCCCYQCRIMTNQSVC